MTREREKKKRRQRSIPAALSVGRRCDDGARRLEDIERRDILEEKGKMKKRTQHYRKENEKMM